jgi:hypothetical protein
VPSFEATQNRIDLSVRREAPFNKGISPEKGASCLLERMGLIHYFEKDEILLS